MDKYKDISKEEREKIIKQAKNMAQKEGIVLDILKDKKTSSLENLMIKNKETPQRREKQEIKISMKKYGYLDIVTGLKNNKYQKAVFPKIYSSLKEKNIPLTLISISIDNFNLIKNVKGENLCTKILRLTGNTLRTSIRDSDEASYLAGHNFTVLIPDTNMIGNQVALRMLRKQYSNLEYIKDELNEIPELLARQDIYKKIQNNPYILDDFSLSQKLENDPSLLFDRNISYKIKKDSSFQKLTDVHKSKYEKINYATLSIGVLQTDKFDNYADAFLEANRLRIVSEKKTNTITIFYKEHYIPYDRLEKLL